MKQTQDRNKVSAQHGHFGWYFAGIFLVALLVRACHLWQIRTATFFSILMGDAQVYDAWARQIAAGDWLGNDVFFQAPLYPYFLGLIYTIFGHNLIIVRICQAVTGSLSCALIADTGRRLFSKPAGITAGIIMAIYAPAIYFDSIIQKSALDLLFLCILVWLLSRLIDKPRWSTWTWVGVTTGCLILTRENAVVMVIAIVFWLFLYYKPLTERHVVFVGLFLIGLASVLLPVAVRNKIVGGRFHLTTSQFGYNFFLGNNEHATGYYIPLHPDRAITKYERTDAVQIAEQAMGKKLTPAEVSKFWTDRALDYITSKPYDWLKLMAKKFAIIWKATEVVDVEDLYTYADYSLPLRLAGYICHFGTIAPLAFFGAWLTWNKRRKLWLFYLIFAVYTASVVIFYMVARYRYPLVPFIVLLASGGLVQMHRFFNEKPILKIKIPITVTIAAAIFCNWPTPETSKGKMQCIAYYNLGVELALQGRGDEAISHYREALKFKPNADVHNNLGNVLARQGKLDEAISHLRRSIQLRPHPDTYYNLAEAFRVQGNFGEAIKNYRQSLKLNSSDAYIVYHKLGNTFRLQGKPDDAISQYQQALKLNPNYAVARYNLGITYMIKGDKNSALKQYKILKDLDNNLADKLFKYIHK